MNDENASPLNRQRRDSKTSSVSLTDCHKRWMEISRDAIAPKISEFPTRVAELTKIFESRRPPATAQQPDAENSSSELLFTQEDRGVNTEITGNFKLHVAEVQSYLTEIATLRRSVATLQREISDLRKSKAEEISDLREEIRILGEVHADEKENFQVEMATMLRSYKTEIRKLEGEISMCRSERDDLKEELSRRLRQLATAAEKYKKLKIGNSNLQHSDFQWQQKISDMQAELELQRENFRSQITDLYWETVHEYEAAFSAELVKQQEIFSTQKSIIAKNHQTQLWNILLWSQALTIFIAFVLYFLAIR